MKTKLNILIVLVLLATLAGGIVSPVRASTSYTMTDLGTLGGAYSWASAINEAGQVVGYSSIAPGDNVLHAFVWDKDNGITDLGTLGGSNTWAYDINEAGQVIGYSYTTGDAAIHTFVWDKDNGMTNLGTLGGTNTWAYDINEAGQVVGDSGTTNAARHAFIATATIADSTSPTITMNTPPDGAAYVLGQTVNADYACQDEAGGSGLASCVGNVSNGSPIDTSPVGVKTFTVSAEDNAGNTAAMTHNYQVIYNFTGFSSPVDNNGVLNVAKAGQTIPLKFRITDANGVPITNLTSASVTTVSMACTGGTGTDVIEEYAAGGSGLQNLGDGYYQWNWKTPTSYANSCKTLRLDLGEGFFHTALFQFRK